MSNKDLEKAPITINIESVNFHFGDCHSTTYYNTDVDEEMELDFDDDGEVEEDAEDTCGCDACKDEKKDSGVKHISEMPEDEKEFLKFILGSVLKEMK